MNTRSTQTTDSTQTSTPWSVQQPYLTQAWQQASNNLNTANQNTYKGEQIAQFTPEQLANYRNMAGYNSSAPGTTAGVGTQLATGGANALTQAMQNLQGYTPSGGTQSNIDAAKAYADGIDISGAVDATMRDANRAVSEQALPQIARSSAMSGNAFSNKRAISEGIVQRGLAEKTADVSAQMRNDAYQKGLSLAEGGRQFDNNAILDAMKSAGAMGGNAANSGVNALNSSINQQGGIYDIINQGGAGLRDANQASLDNERSKAEYATGNASDYLNNFWNIVGSNSWGGTQTGQQTQTSTPSTMNVIGGIMGSVGSLAKAFALSDRRVKTDIKKVGTLDNGLPVYSFRYIGSPVTVIGLMAQDVEIDKPEAVKEFNGIKTVDYEMAVR